MYERIRAAENCGRLGAIELVAEFVLLRVRDSGVEMRSCFVMLRDLVESN